MSTLPVHIVDCSTQVLVEATLYTDLEVLDLLNAEAEWGPFRRKTVTGRSAEHAHWDWAQKADALEYLANTAFGIQKDGKWQGLVMTTTVRHLARLGPDVGKPLVYVKYLESAPWNLKDFTNAPMYGAIGTRLLEAVVRQSLDEGFHGRVGLHALPNPKTESFYQRKGLLRTGVDPNVEGLPYYELTRLTARKFLEGKET